MGLRYLVSTALGKTLREPIRNQLKVGSELDHPHHIRVNIDKDLTSFLLESLTKSNACSKAYAIHFCYKSNFQLVLWLNMVALVFFLRKEWVLGSRIGAGQNSRDRGFLISKIRRTFWFMLLLTLFNNSAQNFVVCQSHRKNNAVLYTKLLRYLSV